MTGVGTPADQAVNARAAELHAAWQAMPYFEEAREEAAFHELHEFVAANHDVLHGSQWDYRCV